MFWEFIKISTSALSIFLGNVITRRFSRKYVSNISLEVFLGKFCWGYILEIYLGISFEICIKSFSEISLGHLALGKILWLFQRFATYFLFVFVLSSVTIILSGKTWETILEHPLGNLPWKSLLETPLIATTNSTRLVRTKEHGAIPPHASHSFRALFLKNQAN